MMMEAEEVEPLLATREMRNPGFLGVQSQPHLRQNLPHPIPGVFLWVPGTRSL
jgi:hypothetical protein